MLLTQIALLEAVRAFYLALFTDNKSRLSLPSGPVKEKTRHTLQHRGSANQPNHTRTLKADGFCNAILIAKAAHRLGYFSGHTAIGP